MIAVDDDLCAIEPNHGELDRTTTGGHVNVAATGFTAVLGVAFDRRGRL